MTDIGSPKLDFQAPGIIRKMILRKDEQGFSSLVAYFFGMLDNFFSKFGSVPNRQICQTFGKNEEKSCSTCLNPFLHGTSKNPKTRVSVST